MTRPKKAPQIAVVLPVYNGERHLGDSIRSVLAQSFTDFELIVVDDGSTDRTPEILAAFTDPRLRIIRFPTNRGVVEALNKGIRESQSPLIARMDADDLSLPKRFERQAAFLRDHPDIDICGTWTRELGGRGWTRRLPLEPEQIRTHLFFGGAMDHPTVMLRRKFLEQNSLSYTDAYPYAEDLDLFMRAAEVGYLANIAEVCLLYRSHEGQLSVTRQPEQFISSKNLLLRQLYVLIPEGASSADADFHFRLCKNEIDAEELPRVEDWLLRLEHANLSCGRYHPDAFRVELRRVWFYTHLRCAATGRGIFRSYWKSSLGALGDVGMLRHMRLSMRALFGSKIVV